MSLSFSSRRYSMEKHLALQTALAHRTREANAVDTSAWVITMSNQQSSDLKLGEDVIWLSGSQAQLKSRVVVSGRRSFLIRGAVSFIPINGSDSYRSSLQIYLYGKEHVTNHPSGIRCSINNAGRMMVAADHMKDASLYMDKEVGSSTSSCYQFELKVSGLEIEFSASAPKFDCHIMQDLVKPQTIKTVLVAKGLTDPFRLIMRNGASEGYAILEQFKLTSL